MSQFPSLQQLSVGCAIICFLVVFIRNRYKGRATTLDVLLPKLLAGSAVPTGFFLLICAFEPTLVNKLTDLSLYLAAAGIALLYVSIKEIISE